MVSKLDLKTDECFERNGGCWKDTASNLTACKDTFKGRFCECPVVNGIRYKGDGYMSCDAYDPTRCAINNGGGWFETQNGFNFSACSGCRCPGGFHGDGHNCEDVNECKEQVACQCDGCSCKNTWGGFNCKCSANLLYIREQDTCIGSKVGLFLTFLILTMVVGARLAGYLFYKYRLRSCKNSEIMSIMSKYMPLDSQHRVESHTDMEPL